jgi:hypothetical protein
MKAFRLAEYVANSRFPSAISSPVRVAGPVEVFFSTNTLPYPEALIVVDPVLAAFAMNPTVCPSFATNPAGVDRVIAFAVPVAVPYQITPPEPPDDEVGLA